MAKLIAGILIVAAVATAGGRNYLQHFVAWIVAWAPGLLTIGLSARRSASKG